MAARLALYGTARGLLAPCRGAVVAAGRSFHAGAVTRIDFETSRRASNHCNHATMWKEWKPQAGEPGPQIASRAIHALPCHARFFLERHADSGPQGWPACCSGVPSGSPPTSPDWGGGLRPSLRDPHHPPTHLQPHLSPPECTGSACARSLSPGRPPPSPGPRTDPHSTDAVGPPRGGPAPRTPEPPVA